MARRHGDQYMVTARYTVGWTNTGNTAASSFGIGDEGAARAKADSWVSEMRAAGAESPIRRVTVQLWEHGASLRDAPIIFEATYYDADQGLTEGERLAAQIHDLHALADRINANYAFKERYSREHGRRMGYAPWPEEFGDKPDYCPACERLLHLDAVHYDNLLLLETIRPAS